MSNGDFIKEAFPDVELKFHKDLNGIRTVQVRFNDDSLRGAYATHIFSRDWWDAEYQKKK
jgi:hypothetical protein